MTQLHTGINLEDKIKRATNGAYDLEIESISSISVDRELYWQAIKEVKNNQNLHSQLQKDHLNEVIEELGNKPDAQSKSQVRRYKEI